MSPVNMSPLLFERLPVEEMQEHAEYLLAALRRRRSVRDFSPEPIPQEVVRAAIEVACQAPSGANQQPWSFVLITDPEVKRQLRVAAENAEREFYDQRAPEPWLDALAPLGTSAEKSFLETAPVLVAVFMKDSDENGRRTFFSRASVAMATAFLVAALHLSGLATVPYTPSGPRFLRRLLKRPVDERPFALLPVGYPAEDAKVPDLQRRPLSESLEEM